jgi:glycosyltransferase involved in cell wall biosynthesis
MRGPLHVTYVVLSLDCGGIERIILNLVRSGSALGHEASVICLERPGDLAPAVERAGARVVCMHKAPGRRPQLVGKIQEVLRELQPHVVHTHQIGALLYSGPAARNELVPVVVHTEHTNQVKIQRTLNKRARARLLWWLAGRYADRFFCVSDDIAAEVQVLGALAGRKVFVVANGIDTRAFHTRDGAELLRNSLGIPVTAPVIGTVGRLSKVKCQDLLLRAFRQIGSERPEARLLLVGDGPERGPLEALARDLGLAGRVAFAGYQPQPEQYLRVMDVFALTSRAEGMPLAILEAWASALPVVATRVGGIPGLVEDGRTGLLVDSGDEPALTQALRRVLAEPGLARRLGEAGRDRAVSEFDTQCMAREYHRHYLELMEHRPETPRCMC